MFSYSSTNIRSINIAIKKRLKNMTIINYHSYDDIPTLTVDYILSVSDADNISDIPLGDINSFLNGLEDYDSSTCNHYVKKDN